MEKESKQRLRLTKLERAWILYDVGNSAFVLMVATLIPIFFNALAAAGGLSSVEYLAYWGYATSVVTIITAILSPILGTLADTKGFKKPIFILCVWVGIVGCIAMGKMSAWLPFLVIFVIAKVGFSGSLVYYDSMLSDVTSPERMDEVSSKGYAWGYIGSCVPFVACLGLVLGADKLGISQMKALGLQVVLLTGDNAATAKHIGAMVGLDEQHVIAGVLPAGKEAEVRRLQAVGRVAMVGDGINDAPALTRADTGIAIGAGTDVAIDAADVVLMNSKLSDVPAAIRLSRAALRNIHENLFWAFIYNIIGIPLAAGVFIPFGLTLNPMFGAAAMSLSSFCVVSNALRLNLFDVHSTKHDRAAKNAASLPAVSAQPAAVANKESTKEDTAMKKTLKVEGMMCGHCEARVKKALEALPEVDEAVVSHEAGTAIVTLNAEVADDVLKKAVEDQDYPVTGIQ